MWLWRRRLFLFRGILIGCSCLIVAFQVYPFLVRQPSSADKLLFTRSTGDGGGVFRDGYPQSPQPGIGLSVSESVKNVSNQPGTFSADEKRIVKTRRIISVFKGADDSEQILRSSRAVSVTSGSNASHGVQIGETEVRDVFISVKTTGKFHQVRVDALVKTWYGLAAGQTFFFTDINDAELSARTNHHTINTNCSAVHSREGLCCKMSAEFEFFITSATKYRWFCHVDDDTYVNIPNLVHLLRQYNHVEDWYIGKPSLNHRLEIPDPDHRDKRISFWFATGGAGFCISRGLALKMTPHVASGRLQATCGRIRLPDDCAVAFILYQYLNVELTPVWEFHSHLEAMRRINSQTLAKQITLSYSQINGGKNIVQISGFSEAEDPTRFLSVHCFLFPHSTNCR